MRQFGYFKKGTGEVVGHGVSVPNSLQGDALKRFLLANAPEGCDPIEGVSDHLSQRVEIVEGVPTLRDWRPPAPDDDYEWNAELCRNVLKPEVLERRRAEEAAHREIESLEQKQLRSMRELFKDPNAVDEKTGRPVRELFDERESQIEQVRIVLNDTVPEQSRTDSEASERPG